MRSAAASGRATLEIRSFRTVFRLERRIYKFDRWRIPIPYGLPVMGLGYTVAALVAVVLAGRIPVTGALNQAIPPEVRYVLVPGVIGYVLNAASPDGRRAHTYLAAWLNHRLRSRHLSSLLRPAPAPERGHRIFEPIALTAEHRRVRGVAVLRLAQPVVLERRGRKTILRPAGDRPLERPRRLRVDHGAEAVWR